MQENDYIMRVIKSTAKGIASILKSGKDSDNDSEIENDLEVSKNDLLQMMVNKYLKEGKINEAENIIFEAIEKDKSESNLNLAIYFYEEINKFEDKKLKEYNFERREILNGLEEITMLFK